VGRGRRSRSEPIDGLLLLNKPAGLTSNQALQRVKRLLNARKAGHTGSLDPAATGMLPLCFGEATKVCAFLLDADKTYRVTAKLGEATNTGDADGEVVETAEVPLLDKEQWASILEGFLGEIEQVPPMYSALKQGGKRLYELARQGITVERPARKVTIYEIGLLEARGTRLVFRVRCSKGTYVRTLVEDIAAAAGTVAHTAKLHRESIGAFPGGDLVDMGTAEKVAADGPEGLRERLMPADLALADWPTCRVEEGDEERFCRGQRVSCDQDGGGLTRVYGPAGRFLGIGELSGDGGVAPKRIFLPDS
jgi:tRNA pseudouridine55 synthase